jgi:RNA polymerase sigma-70 factor (ECF subfamily)
LIAQELDRELVDQVLDGRTEAFNLLVWRWQRSLYNFLYRLTGDREQARDLSQEAFLRAYTRLKDLREKDKFASWLFRIAVNQYHSQFRGRQARESQSDHSPFDETTDLAVATSSAPLDTETRELRMTVRTLIGRLTTEQREVVLLKVYEGFRFEEIASILETPVSTVKSRLYAAFEQLRAGLESPQRVTRA